MPQSATRVRTDRLWWPAVIVMLMLCAALAGCHLPRPALRSPFHAAQAPPRVFSMQPTVEEIVNHLNQNASRIGAWRTTDARIRAQGMSAIALSATVAVERPRNLRVMARSPAGSEVDFGSNDDRFWFWARRSEIKHVFHARHDEMDQARTHFQIPFQPDWLMSTLGIGLIDPGEYALLPAAPGQPQLELVSDKVQADGRQLRHTIVVDSNGGHVVSQTVTDSAGQLIARAGFADHRHDPNVGVWLPHRIELEWPHSEMALTLTIGRIDVNPPAMPDQIFARPDRPGEPPDDGGSRSETHHASGLARQSHRPAAPTAAPEQTPPFETAAAATQPEESAPKERSPFTRPVAETTVSERPSFEASPFEASPFEPADVASAEVKEVPYIEDPKGPSPFRKIPLETDERGTPPFQTIPVDHETRKTPPLARKAAPVLEAPPWSDN